MSTPFTRAIWPDNRSHNTNMYRNGKEQSPFTVYNISISPSPPFLDPTTGRKKSLITIHCSPWRVAHKITKEEEVIFSKKTQPERKGRVRPSLPLMVADPVARLLCHSIHCEQCKTTTTPGESEKRGLSSLMRARFFYYPKIRARRRQNPFSGVVCVHSLPRTLRPILSRPIWIVLLYYSSIP